MGAMTMTYPVDKPEVLKKVKAGDQIMARVYEGDMTLHEVEVMAPGTSEKGKVEVETGSPGRASLLPHSSNLFRRRTKDDASECTLRSRYSRASSDLVALSTDWPFGDGL